MQCFQQAMIPLILLVLFRSTSGGPLSGEENEFLQRTCGKSTVSYGRKAALKSMNTERSNRFEAPFTVLIHSSLSNSSIAERLNGTGMCTGTLISPRHILTAAHCLFDDKYIKCDGKIAEHFIPLTSSGNSTIEQKLDYFLISAPTECTDICDTQLKTKVATPRRAFLAKEWIDYSCNPDLTIGGDVAVIELDLDVEFSLTVQPACLYNDIPPVNSTLAIYGYGTTRYLQLNSSSVMRKHVSQLNPTEGCKELVRPSYDLEGEYNQTLTYGIVDDEICSRHSKAMACMGDSGSGQILRVGNIACVVGVLSRGPKCLPEKMKFPDDAVDISASLLSHKDWICAATGICPSGQFDEEEAKKHKFHVMEACENFDQITIQRK